MNAKQAAEVVSRTKRIETRLTQFMIASGVSTEHKKPEFDVGRLGADAARLTVHSRHTPLSEIVAAIPEVWTGPVEVMIGNDRIATVTLAN